MSSSVERARDEIDELMFQGRYAEAEAQAREALAGLATIGQDDSAAAARTADLLVEALLAGRRGAKPETLVWARRAIVLNERNLGADDVATARSLVRLGRVLATRGEYPESTTTLQRAVRMLESAREPSTADLATARLAVAFLLMKQGKPDEAVPWAEQARDARVSSLGALDPAVAEALELLGTSLALQGNTDEALVHLQRALQICEQSLGSSHPRVGEALVALGEAQDMRDALEQARTTLARGLEMLEAAYGPDSLMIARALSALGYTHLAGAEWPQASRYFERSLAIVLAEVGEGSLQAAEDLLALGIVRNDMGDFAGAAAFETRAVAMLERIFGPWHPQLGRALRHLGVSLTNLGRFAEAEPVMLRSLAIIERNHKRDSYAVANALRSIGDNYYDAGRYEEARSYSLRALQVFSNLEPADQPSASIAYVLGDLGRSSRGLGDPRGALEYETRGLEIHQSVFGPAHPDNAVYLTDIARILFETRQYDAAVDAARRAAAITAEHLRLIARVSAEEQAVAYAGASRHPVDLLLSAVTQLPQHDGGLALAAWDSEIRARGQVLEGLIERRRLLVGASDPELAASILELQTATERLAKLIVRGPGNLERRVFPRELDSARAEMRRAESALAARGEAYRGLPASGRTGLQEVTMALPPGSAMVAFVRYERVDLAARPPPPVTKSSPAYMAFVLPARGATPMAVPLGDAARVDELVAGWRSAIAGEARAAGRASRAGETSYRKVVEDLRRTVWDPLFPALGAATDVFIVPDGTLNLVGLAALPAADGRYLAESGPRLHYLSAERDVTMPAPSRADGGLVAFSAPDFDDRKLFAALAPRQATALSERAEGLARNQRGARSACGSFQSMQFEPLPASAVETRSIVSLWERASSSETVRNGRRAVVALTGSAANETTFKQVASGHRVVHVATHGFFLGDDCGSAGAASRDLANPVLDAVTRENPLLLSGLALAGANHRNDAAPHEDDGILTAQEIATLDLHGTDWAVLSACDTGLGATRAGEGVFGLRRAFQTAGVRTVILSLWSVDDDATRQWMEALYRQRLTMGKSTSESVHGASLEVLQRRRSRGESTHPFYWAGFIAAGDWR